MQFHAFRFADAMLPTICICAGLSLAGCAGTGGTGSGLLDNLLASNTSNASAPPPSPAPEQESCGTPAQCRSALKTMIDDPRRSWVGQALPPGAYSDGTRLFAYRALRKRLSCGELTLAVDEMRTASKSLAGAVGGMTADQVARTRDLCGQVETELTKERAGRCRTLPATSGRSPPPAVPTSGPPGK
jgi:hypothetical protein